MLWVAADQAEADAVALLLANERVAAQVRFSPPAGSVPGRWIITAAIRDPGAERRIRQRLEGLLPRDWR